MRAYALLLGLAASTAAAETAYPPGVALSFAQKEPVRDGALVLEATVRSDADRTLTVHDTLVPWSHCNFGTLYMIVMVNGVGNRLPHKKFVPFCYPGSFDLEPGESKSESITFKAPVLQGVDVRTDLVEFFWIEQARDGYGISGRLDIRR